MLRRAAGDLEREVERCREAYDMAIAVARSPRTVSQGAIDAFVARLERGEYGPMAVVLVVPPCRAIGFVGREIPALESAFSRLTD